MRKTGFWGRAGGVGGFGGVDVEAGVGAAPVPVPAAGAGWAEGVGSDMVE